MIREIFSQIESGFLYFMLIFIGIVIVVLVIRRALRSILHPVKIERVQVANIERQDQNINAVARKMSAGFSMQGHRQSINQLHMSNMGHAMVDNLIYTFYLLDEDNRKIKLKIQTNIGNNMAKVGDVGFVTHQNGIILKFEKNGNVNEKL